jgi:transcriptional regulator with XRE-family HTH domain
MYDVSLDFGSTIRTARKSKGMSAGALGELLVPPVTHAAVCKWETGKNEPGISHMLQLGDILGIDVPIVRNSHTDPAIIELESHLAKMSETQRNAILCVARAMVEP